MADSMTLFAWPAPQQNNWSTHSVIVQESRLLRLPPEILQSIFLSCSTPSFIQLIWTCRSLFSLAAISRVVLLHHLTCIPGYKLGLSDDSTSTQTLWLSVRQRAFANLYGANFHADRLDQSFRHGSIDASASTISQSMDYANMALVLKNSVLVRLYGDQCHRRTEILNPFGVGTARVLKVVLWESTISVLYEWCRYGVSEPDLDDSTLANGISVPEGLKGPLSQKPYEPIRKAFLAPDLAWDPNATPSKKGYNLYKRYFEPFFKQAPSQPLPSYHLFHYAVYSTEPPIVFLVSQPPGHVMHANLVPVDIAVHTQLSCAVLWDNVQSLRATDEAVIVHYRRDWLSTNASRKNSEESYDHRIIWSAKHDARKQRSTVYGYDHNREPLFLRLAHTKQRIDIPRKIAFVHEDQRLALYPAGYSLPSDIIGTDAPRLGTFDPFSTADEFYNATILESTIKIPIGTAYALPRRAVRVEVPWKLETPFWGHHDTVTTLRPNSGGDDEDVDDDDDAGGSGEMVKKQYCVLTYLCLGVATINGISIMGVLRSRERQEKLYCPHILDQLRSMPHTSSNTKLMARLWGWEETTSSLPGVVAASEDGRRIAIARWDRILIWSLEPDILADTGDSEDDMSDTERSSSAGDADSNNNDPTSEHSCASGEQPESNDGGADNDEVDEAEQGSSSHKATNLEDHAPFPPSRNMDYYNRVWDEKLGCYIVELRPIVLKMDRGAVVRQMIWSTPSCSDPSAGSLVTGHAQSSWVDESHHATNSFSSITAKVDLKMVQLHSAIEPWEKFEVTLKCRLDKPNPGPSGLSLAERKEDLDRLFGHEQMEPTATDDMDLDQAADATTTSARSATEKPVKKKESERLTVLTDRGVSIWDLGVWGAGRRRKKWLDEVL